MASRQVTLSPRAVLRVLLLVCLLVLLANCAVLLLQYTPYHDVTKGLIPLFHVDAEKNIPTFFSTFLLLSAALVSFGAGRVAKVDNSLWKVLALVFLFLSLDEFAQLHERLIIPLRNVFGASGFFHFTWIIPYFAFVLVLAVIYLPWLLRLPTRTRRLFVVSAALYLTGALLMEGLSGWYLDSITGSRDVLYILLTITEETCEMVGVILYVYAVSSHIEHDLGGIRFSLGE